MNARPRWAVSAGMTVALVITLALLAACTAVVVGISTYQRRAIHRAKPWLLRMLHNLAERGGHPERLYKLVSDPAVAAALRKLVDTCDRVEAR